MIDFIRTSLGIVAQHLYLAVLVAFLIAMFEAMPVIGLVTPSTVVLVTLGGLVGSGHLAFWPIFTATFLGAIAGDAISYWLGRYYRDRLIAMWPFSHYPALFVAGTRYMERHGGKSVVLGRFVPGVKAVVASIAGMMGMGPVRFTLLNLFSSVIWAAAHILPAYSAGAAFSVLGGISKRLAAVLVALVLAALIVAWLTRVAVRVGGRQLPHLQARLTRWAAGLHRPIGPVLLRLVSPDHSDFRLLVILLGLFAAAIIGTIGIFEDVVSGDSVVRLDNAVSQFLQSLRTGWGDTAMIGVTMFGDTPVTLAVAVAVAATLALNRRRRLALAIGVALLAAGAFVVTLKQVVHAARPTEMFTGFDAFSFPSGHATMMATLCGLLALVALRGLPARAGRSIAAGLGMLVGLIAFSRVYLAAHWPSDVAAGVLFGAAATAGVAVVFLRYEIPRRTAGWTLGAALVAFAIAGTWHFNRGFAAATRIYARPELPVIVLAQPWRAGGWRDLPDHRTDLVGDVEEPILLQWRGTPAELRASLARDGWDAASGWSIGSLNSFATGESGAADLPVIPTLNNGRRAVVTAILPDAGATGPATGPNGRYILRAWPQQVRDPEGAAGRILVGSIIHETIQRPLGLFSIPTRSEDMSCEGASLLAGLPGAQQVGPVQPASGGGCSGPLVLAGPVDTNSGSSP